MEILLFIIISIISLLIGIIIGTKINEMSKYKHCKLIRIRKMRIE
jgi:uncharacterized protein YneF (UPF0154 family)